MIPTVELSQKGGAVKRARRRENDRVVCRDIGSKVCRSSRLLSHQHELVN